MTNKDKLEALMRKAEEGGYQNMIATSTKTEEPGEFVSVNERTVSWNAGKYKRKNGLFCQDTVRLIFSHEFAKALFGEETAIKPYNPSFAYSKKLVRHNSYPELEECDTQPGWQFHLQQAVISKDPINYLYQAVFGEEK